MMAAVPATLLGQAVRAATPVGGGCISEALRVRLQDGRTVFLKHNPSAPPGMFEAEAAGLRWLQEAGAIRVPHVLDVGHDFIVLEHLEAAAPAREHAERLGRELAALHRAGAPAFGGPSSGYIATVPQPNETARTWAEFYAERRLLPMARRAVQAGALPARTLARVETLCTRLAQLCGPPEPPARLHGDLWSGNAITDERGAPVLVDPAAYGGHREIDLAMMRLFGGFERRTFEAYAEAFPLQPGAAERVALYQLYPVLVHVVLFGGGYAAQAEQLAARYA